MERVCGTAASSNRIHREDYKAHPKKSIRRSGTELICNHPSNGDPDDASRLDQAKPARHDRASCARMRRLDEGRVIGYRIYGVSCGGHKACKRKEAEAWVEGQDERGGP